MESVKAIDRAICAIDEVLVILDDMLMQKRYRFLSNAFDCLDDGLTLLSGIRDMLKSEQNRR